MADEPFLNDLSGRSCRNWPSQSRPVSIAFLLDCAVRTWTSQEEAQFRLCQALKGLNITPVLVYAERPPTEIENRLRSAGAEIEIANYQTNGYRYFCTLGDIIDKYSVSMVHVGYFDYFSPIPWLVRLRGIRLILFEQLNGGILRATSWRNTLVQVRAAVSTYPIIRLIAISRFVKGELLKSGVDERKIVVRYLGVDTNRFRPLVAAKQTFASNFSLTRDEIILSTVSTLRPIKDPETIVRACGILATRGVRIRLFVAGDGPMLGQLKLLAKQCGIDERTHWLGYCNDPTMLLQASDIFALASIGEAFGFVLAEAMASGVPVVGSRIGSIPEIVIEGHTGLLATPGDPVAFANAIERLAKDKTLRHEMGLSGIERVRQTFDVAAYTANTIRIYNSISQHAD
jgi:glycosyltransferase involved in cell wall biosynthesis